MYELVTVWATGETEINEFDVREDAEKAERNMYIAFGRQIEWQGIREKRY